MTAILQYWKGPICHECNKGNLIYFKNNLNDALSALVPEKSGKS